MKLTSFLTNNGNLVIAMTANLKYSLASHAFCHLNIEVPKEACSLQLAHTTAAFVMEDALIVVLMESRGFVPEQFARLHPEVVLDENC